MKNIAPAAKSPLSIAIIGAGKIGSTFAYQLARAGHDVTVIARPDSLRFQQLQRDQGIILKTGERAEVRVADKLDEEAAYNLVVVTTPAHQVDAVLPALQRSKAQWVQFMFLTFEPERLRDAIGPRCSFGMPAHSRIPRPNVTIPSKTAQPQWGNFRLMAVLRKKSVCI